MHADPWASMQLHKLACSYISLHAVTQACMQLHKLACSYISIHAIPFVWAAHKNFAVLVLKIFWNNTPDTWNGLRRPTGYYFEQYILKIFCKNLPFRTKAVLDIWSYLGVVGHGGEDAGDGGHVPRLPHGHADSPMSSGQPPLMISLRSLRVSLDLGLVTVFVAEDMVRAEMQISTETRFTDTLLLPWASWNSLKQLI